MIWLGFTSAAMKKDGTVRFCMDYRELNNVINKDTLKDFASTTIFTTLDSKDREKSFTNNKLNLFAIFETLMETVAHGLS